MNPFFTYITAILFLSCTSSDPKGKEALENAYSTDVISSGKAAEFPEKLNPVEYAAWVKQQKGITCSSVSNDQFLVTLIFNPPQLEAYTAALTNAENPEKEFQKYLSIQKGFYYCTAECTIKAESASNPVKKTALLERLKQQLKVIKNNTDTLSNIITEAFPSYVMNQPNKLLILIPNTDSLSNYHIIIQGSPFNLEDCQLRLSSEHIQSFPLIKL